MKLVSALTTTTFLWALSLILTTTVTVTQACSCPLIYETFEMQFDNAQYMDAVYIFGQVRVKHGRFAGFVEYPIFEQTNEDIYFLAYNWKSYKGCSIEDSYEIYVTGGNSALCGVYPEPGWYVVESSRDNNNLHHGFKRLQLCEYFSAWEDFTYDQYWYAEDNKERYCATPYH